MNDSKVFMFPDGASKGNSNSDLATLMPLMNGGGGFGNGSWILFIFLFFLYPLIRNGSLFGNFGGNCNNGRCLSDFCKSIIFNMLL